MMMGNKPVLNLVEGPAGFHLAQIRRKESMMSFQEQELWV